ncbi:MAG: hypothetical protein ACRD4E_05390 [Bryobacteraceae bacterium]
MRFQSIFTLALAVFGGAAAMGQASEAPLARSVATTQTFTTGWDIFNEPLNLSRSNVKWTPGTHKLTVVYKLVGARPSKLYQVALKCSSQTHSIA